MVEFKEEQKQFLEQDLMMIEYHHRYMMMMKMMMQNGMDLWMKMDGYLEDMLDII